MKKPLILLLILLLLAGLTACHRRDRVLTGPESPSDEEQVEPLPDEQETNTSEPGEQEDDEDQDMQAAETAVRDLMAALQSGDREQIKQHIDYSNMLQLQEGQSDSNFLTLMKKVQYEIVEAVVSEKTATVTTKITNVDMRQVLADYFQRCDELSYNNAISEQPLDDATMERQYEQLFADMLTQNVSSTVTNTVEIKLLLEAGNWRVQSGEDLRAAVLGDYFAAFDEARKQMQG